MGAFRFNALDDKGQPREGVLEAADVTAAAAQLQARQWIPLDVQPAGSALRGARAPLWRRRSQIGNDLLVRFTDQLATLLAAGQPIDRALVILQESAGSEAMTALVAELRDDVRGGSTLSDAMSRHPRAFPPLLQGMVKAGEAGGALPQALRRLNEYLERSTGFRRGLVNAAIYPAILMATVLMSMVFLLGYVVPQFAEMYANLQAELPWFSKAVLGLGMFVRRWWWLLLGLSMAALFVLNLWLKQPASKPVLDAWLLRRKGLGPLLGKIEAERWLRTLGTLLESGVPMMNALRIGQGVLSNQVLTNAIRQATEAVRGGARLSDALASEPHFPRLPLQMMRVGEEAGELDALLLKAADTLEHDIKRVLDRAMAALVPVVTVVMFVLIGVVVMSILVPLYDLTSVI
ncbi:type II secretion system F family protein [Lysobacter pythonis]|uniref:Type II secretion system F family protein n=1 Tax=Solilutibacter pythonis TaxID=2483112 RepID=A0A3M2HFZ1_9GAMM|nr:type II secretion system F family protein [Lysobacter pythonis]RMH87878.1 type II secretion system F family protein [Lysobacter pythonis]